MIWVGEKLYLEQNYLSNIELYYSQKIDLKNGNILIEGDESRHIQKVMRHQVGDELYVTDDYFYLPMARYSRDLQMEHVETDEFS